MLEVRFVWGGGMHVRREVGGVERFSVLVSRVCSVGGGGEAVDGLS